MRKSILSISGILLLGGILILANGISQNLFSGLYADLTEEGLYSLSQGTKNIISEITDKITLKFYYSKTEGSQFPGIKLYGSRVADLLKEYQRVSKGKINVEIYDPRPDSEEEGWAQGYGLTPIPTREGDQLFLGIAAVGANGKEEAIPVLNLARQEFLEYDITKLVYSLATTKRPVVGILSSIDLGSVEAHPNSRFPGMDQQKSWFFLSQISQFAEVKEVKSDTSQIDNSIQLLMIVHPKNLSDQTLYAIDQFVMKGGNLLVLEDPYSQQDNPKGNDDNPMAAMSADHSSSLNKLLKSWGVELMEKKVVGDIELATKVSGGGRGDVQDFVLWLNLGKKNINRDDVTTSQLENIVLPWSGALKLSEVENVTTEQLLTTTEGASLFDENEYRFNGGDPENLLKHYVRGKEKQVLAARLHGKFKSNFPSGKPGAAANSETTQNMSSVSGDHLTESKSESNIVVIADIDFIADRFSVSSQSLFGTPIVSLLNDNLVFLQNTVEALLGSNDLISIRSRGQFSRPFTRVQALEMHAQEKWQQEETVLQAKLNAANQRLNQLQAAGGPGQIGSGQSGSGPVFTKALLDEIKKFRDERQDAQKRLRQVRRNLRQDKESLGVKLFVINTFFVPLLLIIFSVTFYFTKSRKKKHQ